MDVGIYLLNIKEHTGERSGQIKRCVRRIVGAGDQSIGEGDGGKRGIQESFVVNVRRLRVSHDAEVRCLLPK
jgi:hypothetical protein